MFSSERFDWFRKHPLASTVAAFAAAAYSFAQFHPAEVAETSSQSSESGAVEVDHQDIKVISWGDDNGGSLTEVIQTQDELYDFAKHSLSSSESCCEKVNERDKVLDINHTTSTGESSPNFGWFVSFTPPQKLYMKPKGRQQQQH